jgi:predicted AAA+ superfamily ATPase
MLHSGMRPNRILHVQFDELKALLRVEEPILRIVDWYEETILGESLNDAAAKGEPAFLIFDEVQNLDNWAQQLKHLVDNSTTQVLVTGSSALRIEQGRDSLSGRISTIEAGVLSLTEIAAFHRIPFGTAFLRDNGLDPLLQPEFWRSLVAEGQKRRKERDETFRWFSERGGYPLVHERAAQAWGMLADQLNENVIKRVIQHDLRIGDRGRKRDAALLEEVFRMACRYVGQTPSALEFAKQARETLNANIGSERVRHYLRFLGDTLLLRLIPPLEIRLTKKKGNAKICLADHGLRASWLQEVIPIDSEGLRTNPHLSDLAGHIAESVVGNTLSTINSLDLAHLPQRGTKREVDFIMTIGTRRIPVEVKYQNVIDPNRDIEGVQAFMDVKANNSPLALLITRHDAVPAIRDPRIIPISLPTFMMIR